MLKTKRYIPLGIFIFFLMLNLSVLLIIIITKPFKEDKWKDYHPALGTNEIIIDAVPNEEITYAITNKAGYPDYGDTLVVFEQEHGGSFKRFYENDFKDLKPWKIRLADIDGDGSKEILTAVRKTTHFDKHKKNRMFIFNFTDGKLIKKWTGSQIAGTWEDFIAGDFVSIKGNELIFISRTELGERVSVYYWYDFGFLMLAESKDYEDILSITIPKENRIAMTYRKAGKEQTMTLRAHDDKLIEVVKDK